MGCGRSNQFEAPGNPEGIHIQLKALVICNAGPALGLGHLARALRVASGLTRRLGALVTVSVLGPEISYGSREDVQVQFIENSGSNLKASLLEVNHPNLVLLDLAPHQLPSDLSEFLSHARERGIKLIGIDGLLRLQDQLDLVFIPSFRSPALPESNSRGTRIVYGWDCFLLDDIQESPPWQPGSRVLALTGGGDTTSLGASWPCLLNSRLPDGTELNWVTGPYSNAPLLPEVPRVKIANHAAPRGLQHLMASTNYAVTVYGVSFFELLQFGVPTVVFSPYGDKDDLELQEIEREEVALVARDKVDATEKLVSLMSNDELAHRLSRSARQKLRSSGIDRLCSEVSLLMSESSLHSKSNQPPDAA